MDNARSAEVSFGEAVTTESDLKIDESMASTATVPVFGQNLFQGSFTAKSQPYYNPKYRVAIGDTINLRIWGSFELVMDVSVDNQGNIFIPKVGTVDVGGVTNQRLIEIIEAKVHEKYNQRLYVYANVAGFQPVWVFVTGNVNKPGLYQGMASDSVLQFIDKAKGINLEYGSFRNITIVRNNKPIKHVDLYDFLTAGRMDLFQFHDGDSVLVGDIKHRVTVTGDVKRPFRFEFSKSVVDIHGLLSLAIPNPSATNMTLTRWMPDNSKILRSYALDQLDDLIVLGGDAIDIYADNNDNAIITSVTGEHDGLHTLLLPKGVTLTDLLDKVEFTKLSDIDSIQLFRKSVAEKQKQLLLAKLQELESLVLTTSSISKDEALMRSQEAKSILTFIDRAKKVEPKGQVVIHNKDSMNEIYLEEGDQVFIPRKTNVVLVQGEVNFPGAHTHLRKSNVEEYIALSGDFSERANKNRVLLIKQNGSVVKIESKSKLSRVSVDKGDSILVLPKLEGKSIQITKDITQILYQIAVGAGVILAI
jgi:protein involved in polysaccharide export with SLBB domain